MQIDCRICAASFTPVAVKALEMMFGTRESFDYATCPSCQSVQIVNIPCDIARHYRAETYYSFQRIYPFGLKERLRRMRDASYFGGGGPLGRLLAKRQGAMLMQVLYDAGLRPNHRVLDVGSGAGFLLDRLARIGFQRVSGVDPFVPEDMHTPSGVTIAKAEFRDITSRQDVIMFNHSLEHVFDPAAELRHAASLLKGGGRCIVRIPTPSSTVWETYGVHWSQLDAPRHISLPSREGLTRLAERTGFALEKTIDDSWSFGFWGSELYRDGVALQGSNNAPIDPVAHFGARRVAQWAAMATTQNAASRGDQVAFVLRALT